MKVNKTLTNSTRSWIMIDIGDYLRTKKAAKYLGVHDNTLRKMEIAGKIKAARHPINGYRLFLKKDLEDILAQALQHRPE